MFSIKPNAADLLSSEWILSLYNLEARAEILTLLKANLGSLDYGLQFYRRTLEQGLILLYYRGKNRGSWSVRIYNTKAGKYGEYRIGLADDFRTADGIDVLDFKQAQEGARQIAEEVMLVRTGKIKAGPHTVKNAVDDYLDWFKAHRKSHRNVENRLNCHVIPHFGNFLVMDLTRDEIEKWHRKMAQSAPRVGGRKTKKKRIRENSDPRARKVTANRTLSYFKAALNRAHMGGKVLCDPVWKTVEPFKGVEKPRVEFLTQKEAKRLINSAGPEVRPLMESGRVRETIHYSGLAVHCDQKE